MQSTITFALLCCIVGAVVAHPSPDDMTMPSTPAPRYPLNLQGGGGAQEREGLTFGVRGSENVWRSDNGRHEIDVNGGYAQRLGGQWGNSEPSYSVGTNYRYRW
ncbi:diptericin A [Drosophila madeirensis]|uniref:Diptericin A n=1 Tax=Drosophila madeirensis TaxID=30013 RepID=A0AAU9GEL6_DROMD